MPQPTNPQNAQPSTNRSAPPPKQDPYIQLGPGLQAMSPQELAQHVNGMNLSGRLGKAGERIERAVLESATRQPGRSAPVVREHTHHTVIINGSGSVPVPRDADFAASILTGVGGMLSAAGKSLSQADVPKQRPARSHTSGQYTQASPPLQPEKLTIVSGSIFPQEQRRGGPPNSSKRPPPPVPNNITPQAPQPPRAVPVRPRMQLPILSPSTPPRPVKPLSTATSTTSTTIFTPPPSTQAGSTRGNSVNPRFPPSMSTNASSKVSSASTTILTPTSSRAAASNTGRVPSGPVPPIRGPVDTVRKPVTTDTLATRRKQHLSSSNQPLADQQQKPLPPSKRLSQSTSGAQQSSRPPAAAGGSSRTNAAPLNDPFRTRAQKNPLMTQAKYDAVMNWNPGSGDWR